MEFDKHMEQEEVSAGTQPLILWTTIQKLSEAERI